jgi:hypothetical protein
VAFSLSFTLQVWLAHALAFFLHEFGHSFAAWIAGYKMNPWALNYGHLSVSNLLLMVDIDENVDYAPIFAAGKGYVASAIAFAGVFANAAFYIASGWLYSSCRKQGRRSCGLFAFLLCLMNVGNFFDYVPVRTFAPHGDMATLEKGLGVSLWWIIIVLGLPFAAAIWHFFARLLPDARIFLYSNKRLRQIVLVAFSAFVFFVFFGASGIHGYGEPSHLISAFSAAVLFPVALILCWPRNTPHSASG